ncbi:MAG TPA: rod-binding protein [Pirellulaceae bacterium]|nr:rod-binding protein [Pirellulaceae bacterium]
MMNLNVHSLPAASYFLPLPADPTSFEPQFLSHSSSELEKVGIDFEALFYSLILKEMRNSIGGDEQGGLFPGENTDSLGGMFDMFLGQHLASSGQLGISRMIAAYLANQQRDRDDSTLNLGR